MVRGDLQRCPTVQQTTPGMLIIINFAIIINHQYSSYHGHARRTPSESTISPLVVLEVDDLDTARGRTESAGGTITVESFECPGGRHMHFLALGDNELAVWGRACPSILVPTLFTFGRNRSNLVGELWICAVLMSMGV